MKIFFIILGITIYGFIWLYGAIWEECTEDERLDKLYKKLDRRKQN